ncbi:probable dolichyl pyrophosphate Man9GlcNAc2 alpha-1,3-glucosyltransferase [Macadamia integrifolia]|uniref:probable dolichyl pyrophosphate Man9GlcNAc2 alpha-1,3-glucosyltransferase n=1 Tax=Macadamia integrifolia TaxID=60698 RepID=UPI001C532DE6|nr:probable dolichyl pyrophosphate Man9GlcNAc2 alpha-1,3-glucosyltransferase [Macadamia integrifolia]XP_042475187.1 probable dolichyl pyrophosphate Man9GlcNAc2 alpha-1,3-glucosyltransferase [Macadamia integrifolia]
MGKKAVKEVDKCDVWWWLANGSCRVSFLCIAIFALLMRVGVSFHPYSGAGDPPKYGDYEAQRHWMEITLNTATREWYRNSTTNDLHYWGLDYPPLTAYQSYIHALFLNYFHPDSVALFTSRGHESPLGKLLMRWTVLSSDALIFFPAVLFFIMAYYTGRRHSGHKEDMAWHLAVILVSPCLILIDHGHFQYNCISLGFTVGAVAAIFSENNLVACFLFSLALNHKQMSLYFAPAFFSHLLGKCFKRRYPLLEVLKLGFTVIGTFVLNWWPYLYSTEAFKEVLFRLAPFERGLYEDYVANFWCTTSMLIKWKKLFTTQSLKLLSFSATVLGILPSMVRQLTSPSDQGFLYALLNSSFAFYLFSFQVHEKSILLPLLPASLLALEEPLLFKWFTFYAMFSMYPLLCRDHLILPYMALLALFLLIYYSSGSRQGGREVYLPKWAGFVMSLLLLCSVLLHLIYLTFQPPEKYPFFFEAMIMFLCFPQFVLLTLYTNTKQWRLSKSLNWMEREKKLV